MKKIAIIVLVILVLSASGYFMFGKRASRFLSEWIGDNIEHGLSCEELPALQTVEKTILENRAAVEQVLLAIAANHRGATPAKVKWDMENHFASDMAEGQNGSYGLFSWGPSPDCVNKHIFDRAEVVFGYPTHKDRQIIQNVFGKTFYGLPYRGQNY